MNRLLPCLVAASLLAGCATLVHFHPGEALFREGEPADAFFILRSGRVSVQVHNPAGGPIVVDTVEYDEVVGWCTAQYISTRRL